MKNKDNENIKNKNILAILVLGVFLLSFLEVVYADFRTSYCACECKGEVISAKGYGKNIDEAKASCEEMCGRACGAKTDCDNDCESCCESSDKGCGDVTDNQGKEGCKDSCQKTCEFKGLTGGIIDIIYTAAGIVAAIMIIIHGFKFISSQNPADRDEAKKAILFVIFALIVIGVGGLIVKEFAERIVIPKEEIIPEVKGCGGKILSVRHVISGDEIEVYVYFINNGDKKCGYRAQMWELNHVDWLEDEPDICCHDADPFVLQKIKLSSKWDPAWDVYHLRGGYIVELLNSSDDVIDTKTVKLPAEFQCSWEFPHPKDDPEHGFRDSMLWIPIKYDDKSTNACEYRVKIYTKDGRELKTSGWETHADWTFKKNAKEFAGGYKITFEETHLGLIPEEEKIYEFPEEYICANNAETNVRTEIHDPNVWIYITIKNNAKIICEYDVSIQDNEGNEKESVGFRVGPDSEETKKPYHRTWKFNRGVIVLNFTDRASKEQIDRKEIFILSDEGKSFMDKIEQGLIDCWGACKGKADRDAKCFTFDPNNPNNMGSDDDRIWRSWIEKELEDKGKKDVSDALDRWYADDPLKSTSEEFCIVFRKIGNREQVQVRKSSDNYCNADEMNTVCV